MDNNKIIIAGGTGFIGRSLAEYFATKYQVIILTRNKTGVQHNNAFTEFEVNKALASNIKLVEWNGKKLDAWAEEFDNASAVINLAGKSVNCRYTKKNRQEIFDSRILSTRVIGEAIKAVKNPPKLWINAASATIYRNALDRPQNEFNGEIQNDFSVQVCKLWEQTFFEMTMPGTRKIALRTAITLGSGGVMKPYLNLIKFGLGGRQGSGKQMYSWVHIEDVCRAIDFVMKNEVCQGVYNLSAPNPVTNKEFMQTLRKATGASFGLPAYKWMLAIGAAVIGTEAELILKSRWLVPTKLLEAGFVFKYPVLKEAVENIVANTPRKKYHFF
jgi:hypothetical protein